MRDWAKAFRRKVIWAGAAASHQEASKIREGLVRIDVNNADWQSDLSGSHTKLGALQEASMIAWLQLLLTPPH